MPMAPVWVIIRLLVIMYSVFLYLTSSTMEGPNVNANPTRTKGKPNRVKKPGAPIEAELHIQKIEKARKINPKGIAASPGSMNAFLTGLPPQTTFSSLCNNLPNLETALKVITSSFIFFLV